MSNELKRLIELHAAHVEHVAGLAAKIAEKRAEAKAESVSILKAAMAEAGLTPADLGGVVATKPPANAVRNTVAPKFVNHATGETWSGRGMRPRWLKSATDAGMDVEHFRIKPALATVAMAA